MCVCLCVSRLAKFELLCNTVEILNFPFYRIFLGGTEGTTFSDTANMVEVEDSDASRTDSTSALHQRVNICQDTSDMNLCFAQQPGNKAVISPSEVLHQRTCEKKEKRDAHHRGYRKRFSQLSRGIRQVFNPLNDFKTDLDRGNSHVIHLYR